MTACTTASQGPVSTARLAAMQCAGPRLSDLEPPARRRLPRICFNFLQGGTGAETSRPRNHAALGAVQIVPRYGADLGPLDTATTLLGVPLSAPLLIAPVGMDGATWPEAAPALAAAAEATGVGYMPGSRSATTIEDLGPAQPDRLFFQIYGTPENDHRLALGLAHRATVAGARALAMTLDIPLPGRRVRDLRNGLTLPVRLTPRRALDLARRPAWLAALARHGRPRFANIAPYAPPGASPDRIAAFVRALACGADAVMVGRGFLPGLAAFGPAGAHHVARTLIDEFRIALGQTGALTVAGARTLAHHHPDAWPPERFQHGAEPARPERKIA